MKNIIVVHEDALNLKAMGIEKKNDDLVAFAWDEEYFKNEERAFKQKVFLYECLCQLEIKIYKGSLIELCHHYESCVEVEEIQVIKPYSFTSLPSLDAYPKVTIIQREPWLKWPTKPARSFFKFWKQVEGQLK